MNSGTLTETQMNVNSEEFIYNPGFSLNISEVSPIIYKTVYIPRIKSFLWETERSRKLKNLHTKELLFALEEQLLDIENHHYKIKLAPKILARRNFHFNLISNNNCYILYTKISA